MSAPEVSKRKKAKRAHNNDETPIIEQNMENSPKRPRLEDKKEKTSLKEDSKTIEKNQEVVKSDVPTDVKINGKKQKVLPKKGPTINSKKKQKGADNDLPSDSNPNKKKGKVDNGLPPSDAPSRLEIKQEEIVSNGDAASTKTIKKSSKKVVKKNDPKLAKTIEKGQADSSDSETMQKSQIIDKKDVLAGVWHEEDEHTLLGKINQASCSLPELQKYSTTMDKLNWEDIKFGAFSANECKEKAVALMNKVRKYRTLIEILDDVKVLIVSSGGLHHRRPGGGPVKYTNFEAYEIPKKPMSPYFRYFREMKDSLQKLYPQLSQNDLFKILSDKFNKLPDRKKRKYTDAYNAEMEAYQQQKDSVSRLKQAADPVTNPKIVKPLTPFQVFIERKLKSDKYVNMDKKLALEKLKKKWSETDEDKKFEYIKEALRLEWQYLDKVNKHLEDNPDVRLQGNYKSTVMKAERVIFDRITGKPEKPPNSGYSMFSCEKMRTLKLPTNERMNAVSLQWKQLPEEEKTKYSVKASEANKEYKKKMEVYLKQFTAEEKDWINKDMKVKKKHPKGDGDANGIPPPTGKENSKKRKLFKGEPKKPPMNAYAQYTAEQLSNLIELKPKSRMQEIARLWKILPDDEKKKYKEKSRELLEEYNGKLAKFMKALSPEDLKRYEELTKSSNQKGAGKPAPSAVKEESSSEENSDNDNNSSDESDSDSDSSSSDEDEQEEKKESSDDDDDTSSTKSSSTNNSSKAKQSSASNDDSSDDSSSND